MKFLILLLVTITTAASTSANEAADEVSHNDRSKLFFGAVSTQSHTLVSFTTSTVFFSCFNGVSLNTDPTPVPTVCPGKRRKRRRSTSGLDELSKTKDDVVYSSQSTNTQLEQMDKSGQSGKLFFTVWTKSVATTTLTTFFTNSDTTLSLSYWCSLGAVNTPAAPC